MTRWILPTVDGVRALAARVDSPVFSPDGTLMAFWRTREASHDLVVRERVYVIELSTGREVVALDGPHIVRALAFVGDDHLLVQRDVSGAAWLGLHCLPDGGVVAETMFSLAGGMETELQVCADRSRVYSAPNYRTGTRKVAEGFVCSLPDLTITYTFSPYSDDISKIGDLGVAGRSAINAEGTFVAVYYHASRQPGFVAVHALSGGRPKPRVFLADIDSYKASIQWISRSHVLLGTLHGMQAFVCLDTSAEIADPGRMSSVIRCTSSRFNAYDGSLDLDGARMVGLLPTKPGVPRVADGLCLLDPRTGSPSRLPTADDRPVPDAVAWAADNRHLLLARGGPTHTVVSARTEAGQSLGGVGIAVEPGLPVIHRLGDGAVALTVLTRANWFACALIDPEALGLSRLVLRAGAR